MINIKWNKKILAIIPLFISIFFTTIVYASFNTQLQIKGEAVVKADQEIRITDFKLLEKTGEAAEVYNSKFEYNTTSLFVKLPASTQMTYEITVTNKNPIILYTIKNLLTLNNNNPNVTVTHEMQVGDCIEANTSKKFLITLANNTLEEQLLNLNNQYEFETANWKSLETKFLSASNTGDLTVNKDGIIYEFSVTNPNTFNVDYSITLDNGRFIVTNVADNNTSFRLTPGDTKTHQVKINLRNDVTYENITESIKLMLKSTYPTISNIDIESITLTLPQNFKSKIITSMAIETTPANFSSMEAENGYLYRITDLDDASYTYYYRGVINNNYVSFAGQLWRIVRVDYNGNIRLVLNDNAMPETRYNANYSSNNVANVDEAITLVDYRNSNVRQVVENWYNENILPNSDNKYVMNTNFCIDNSYTNPIQTQHGHTIYYFAPYQNVGVDVHNFSADFSCSAENTFTNVVGLLQAEDVLAAGGYWQTVNKNYFLYNPNKAEDQQTSWTMSGSYYSLNEKQAGVIVFNQTGEGLFDWVQGGNLTQFYGFRPVISINGNVNTTGDGTIDNPYQISQ